MSMGSLACGMARARGLIALLTRYCMVMGRGQVLRAGFFFLLVMTMLGYPPHCRTSASTLCGIYVRELCTPSQLMSTNILACGAGRYPVTRGPGWRLRLLPRQ